MKSQEIVHAVRGHAMSFAAKYPLVSTGLAALGVGFLWGKFSGKTTTPPQAVKPATTPTTTA